MPPTISKSKYLSGLQCEKLLWTHYNARHLIPPPDAGTQWIFDQGHEIGRLAQQLAPGGREVPFGQMERTVEATARLLPLRKPIYEASFLAAGVYCRVDILRPSENGTWDLLEVKSSTKVKPVNIHDIAVQRHCLEAAGLELNRLYLVHIDRSYVRAKTLDPEQLFHAEDVTAEVDALADGVGPNLSRMQGVLAGDEPQVAIGAHCDEPYECPLKSRCWAFLPDHNVTTLIRAGKKAFDWIDRGWIRVGDVPENELSTNQRVQANAVRSGHSFMNRDAVRSWLDALEYPLLFLDFEACSSALPAYLGTSPYEQVPFQASVHIVDAPGAEASHREYLATTPQDPRPALVEFLVGLPGEGSVVAYHMDYERRILEGLAEEFPDQAALLLSLRDRLVDLEEPFRHFDYYHPEQRGRSSIKAVLPALTPLSYEGDAISDGQQASREFLRVVHGDVEDAERERVLEAMREYCKKDTWAMVEILAVLEDTA